MTPVEYDVQVAINVLRSVFGPDAERISSITATVGEFLTATTDDGSEITARVVCTG